MSSYEQVETFEEVREGELITNSPDESVIPQKDDDRLDYTQSIRGMVINQLMEGGKAPIHDKDQMGMLDKMLNGVDKQVLGKKRIDTVKDIARDINGTARMLEELSKQASAVHGKDPLKSILQTRPPRDPSVFNRDIRNEFDDILPEELTIERREENSEEFFKRFETARDNDKK